MNQVRLKTLMDRWSGDARFRQTLRANPEAAIKSIGMELDAEELAALRAMDWSLPDKELEARVSKGA